MHENWARFVECTRAKSAAHNNAAHYWNSLHNIFSVTIIFLGTATTILSLIKAVPHFAISAVAAVNTLVSTVSAFLRPHERHQRQLEASKDFRILMMKMIRCETEPEYEELWREMNKIMIDEPFIPEEFANKEYEIDWTMTPELRLVIAARNDEIDGALGKLGKDRVKDAMDAIASYDNSKIDLWSGDSKNHESVGLLQHME